MDLKSEYLNKIIGAESITLTVLNHYYEGIADEPPEEEILSSFKELSEHLKLQDQGFVLLSKILGFFNDFKKDCDKPIEQKQFNLVSETCENYVNWVFTNFDCFEKAEDGEYIYHSNPQ